MDENWLRKTLREFYYDGWWDGFATGVAPFVTIGLVAGGLVAAYCAGWHSTNPHK